MPELPEVETTRRGLAGVLEGHVLTRVQQRRADLRLPIPDDFVARLQGNRVVGISRRSKYLLIHMADGLVVLCHLGMSGRFVMTALDREAPPELGPHDHLVFETDGRVQLIFRDPRRFGLVTFADAGAVDSHPLLAEIGPEPLGNAFSAAHLDAGLAGRRTPIKAALLDQRLVAGLGNIYVCEALFRARISPRRSAHTVVGRRAARLVPAVRAVLGQAIDAGGSTLRDYAQVDGELGYFQTQFLVYGREGEPCVTDGCTATVRRIVQSNRSTFFCPRCQR